MTDTNVSLDLNPNTKKIAGTILDLIIIGLIIYIIYVIFFKDNNHNKNNETFVTAKNENIEQKKKMMYKINHIDKLLTQSDQNVKFPNLENTQPYTNENLLIQNLYEMNHSQSTPDVKSLELMNQAGMLNGEKISCNMLGIDTSNMNEYKKNYYSMYAHQIECPAKCGLKSNGMSKGCGMGSKCRCKNTCSNLINTDTSIPDTFALNYLALDNANKKSCVTCNFKPNSINSNNLNREWMEPNYNDLPNDVKNIDSERLNKKKLIDSNVSNYVNFENNTNQNSIGDTQVDKINEIRSCINNNGTCNFSDYGNKISEVYDKLLSNPSYSNRNNCNSYQLTGILENSAYTDSFSRV